MDYVSAGKLYIVATPIGHLEDISLRALNVLKEVDIILSEDTRETFKLLSKYGIDKPQTQYNDATHEKNIDYVLQALKEGKSLALLSDSGTPLISDPGFKLVRKLRKDNFSIIAIPGPSAPVAALSISGLPTDNFTFIGFLPKTKIKRETAVKKHKDLDTTLIYFVSSHHINRQISEFYELLGDRTACVTKDLTKMFEKVITAPLSALKNENFKEKGEYMILIAKEGYSLDG